MGQALHTHLTYVSLEMKACLFPMPVNINTLPSVRVKEWCKMQEHILFFAENKLDCKRLKLQFWTLWGKEKMATNCRRHFQMHCLE